MQLSLAQPDIFSAHYWTCISWLVSLCFSDRIPHVLTAWHLTLIL